MGVMTSSQFAVVDKNIGIVEGNAPSNRGKLNIDAVNALKFPPAPMGKSTANVPCNEVEEGKLVLKLEDGIFIIPKNWGEKRSLMVKKTLLADNWEDVSHMAGVPVVKKDPPKEYKYFAGHPDNTDAVKINGNIGLKIKKKDVQLECVEGVIETELKTIYQKLLKDGWYEAKPAEEIVKESE